MVPVRSDQVYCSNRCRLIAWRRREAEKEGDKPKEPLCRIRCPCCGMVPGSPRAFVKGALAAHDLEMSRVKPLSEPGHKGGFAWEEMRPLTRGLLAELLKLTKATVERLEQVLEFADAAAAARAGGGAHLPIDDVHLMIQPYVDGAQDQAERKRRERIRKDTTSILIAEQGDQQQYVEALANEIVAALDEARRRIKQQEE